MHRLAGLRDLAAVVVAAAAVGQTFETFAFVDIAGIDCSVDWCNSMEQMGLLASLLDLNSVVAVGLLKY